MPTWHLTQSVLTQPQEHMCGEMCLQNERGAASALTSQWHWSPLAWFQVTKCARHRAANLLSCLEAITSFIFIVVIASAWQQKLVRHWKHSLLVFCVSNIFPGWNQAPGGFQVYQSARIDCPPGLHQAEQQFTCCAFAGGLTHQPCWFEVCCHNQ